MRRGQDRREPRTELRDSPSIRGETSKGDKEGAASEVRGKPEENALWKPNKEHYFQEEGVANCVKCC